MRLLFLFLCLPTLALGQCYNRYTQAIFPSVQVQTNIHYGTHIDAQGDSLSLFLDFYAPSSDTLHQRPLLILLHGKDFVTGSKEDSSLVYLSERLARQGFTVAAINYSQVFSLQSVLDKKELFRSSLRAAQDAKAAVRFFRKMHQQQANLYSIDTSMIWLGGIGSGSMAAQMAVYLDDTLEVAPPLQAIIQAEGGLEGNSGQPLFSSTVKGVLNLSGATIDSDWMSNNTEPILNIHGLLDNYYPYMSDSLFQYTHNTVCNGHHELCYKRLNEVTFVQTHNAHADDGSFSILAANQNGNIPAQLAAGVRGLGLKLYYTSSIFCGSGTKLYAYHGNPLLGCTEFSTIGNQISDFLTNNPDEFLFITIEGSASNSEIATGFNSAGLAQFLYQHTLGEIWPTLGELIQNNQRLIVMTDNSGASLQGYHHLWTFAQDTEYDFTTTNDFNCNYLRGNLNSDLFLVNHFLTVGSPQPLSAGNTNDWNLVLNRARQCGSSRNLHPNLLYIDFFNSGDVFRAADTLNQIGKDFPFVYGSSTINSAAAQQGLLSELYTINNHGFSPYNGSIGDSAAFFIGHFLTNHFPCELSCVTPVYRIIGEDSILVNSTYLYAVAPNLGSNYQWITTDSIYDNSNAINIQQQDSSNFLLHLVETSQYGCVFDTITLAITASLQTAMVKLKPNSNLRISPNPVQDKLSIHLDFHSIPSYLLKIYTLQGQLIYKKQHLVKNNTISVPLQDLEAGIYILSIPELEDASIKFSKF
ncbi:MAG: poly(3-hydroxybutyrate) depolymerase [Aureispira sp.]|jgi:poly(3-hydroxybutyrate) depolymerase